MCKHRKGSEKVQGLLQQRALRTVYATRHPTQVASSLSSSHASSEPDLVGESEQSRKRGKEAEKQEAGRQESDQKAVRDEVAKDEAERDDGEKQEVEIKEKRIDTHIEQ